MSYIYMKDISALYMAFKFVYCFAKFLAFLTLNFTFLKALYLPPTVGSYYSYIIPS